MRLQTVAIPMAAAVVAFMWMPHKGWDEIDEGLLAFLGLIAAGLVQIIPTTINFLQPEHVTPAQARTFNTELERLQDYWLGLLVAVMGTAAIVIIGRLLIGHTALPLPKIAWYQIPDVLNVAPFVSSVMAGALAFVAERAITVVPLVRTLQRQRSAIVLEAAARIATERQKEVTPPLPSITPDGYGKIVHH